jgi:choline kinase
MKPTLLILAAGMGSRYGGLKQVDPVGLHGEAIIDYSIFDAIRSGFGKVVFVIRESFADDFRAGFDRKLKNKIKTAYVYQELNTFVPESAVIHPDRMKPWGTGHAVLVARDVIKEPFVVINADDFYGPSAYSLIPKYLSTNTSLVNPQYCMVGYRLSNTLSDHGYVSRGVCQTNSDEFLETVVERTHIEKIDGKIISKIDETHSLQLSGDEVVSMNIWGFMPSFFGFLDEYFEKFIRKNAGNPKAEFYIPYVVNELIRSGTIALKVLRSNDQWFGVTYKEDKIIAETSIRQLTGSGIYPVKLWDYPV